MTMSEQIEQEARRQYERCTPVKPAWEALTPRGGTQMAWIDSVKAQLARGELVLGTDAQPLEETVRQAVENEQDRSAGNDGLTAGTVQAPVEKADTARGPVQAAVKSRECVSAGQQMDMFG